jgi:hypothetical protein
MNYGQNNRIMGAHAPVNETYTGDLKRQTQPVLYQMEVMEKNIARLQDVLIQLESRLSPITRPLVAPTNPVPESDANSPMGQRLYHFNALLDSVHTNIGLLHDALEI